MTYSSEVLADAPVVFYKLAEPSGTTATDSSGNGHTGTYSGAPTLGAAGLSGDADTAATFTGISAQRAQSNATVIAAGAYDEFTMEWLANVPTDLGPATFTALQDPTVGDPFAIVQCLSESGNAGALFYSAGHTLEFLEAFMPASGRHHFVMRLLAGIQSLWIDGVQVGSRPAADMVLSVASSFYVGSSGGSVSSQTTIAKPAYYDFGLADDRIVAHAAAAGLYVAPVVDLPDLTGTPTVRLVTARALVVPHQVQRWVLPIICAEHVVTGEGDDIEQSQNVAEVRDFFLGLRRTGTPVVYQEGTKRHLVVVRDVSFPDGQVTRWGTGRNGVQGLLMVTLDSTEA